MSISTAHYSNIASKASVSHHFLCVQCARLAIMAMAGRNRTPPPLPPNFEAGYGPASVFSNVRARELYPIKIITDHIHNELIAQAINRTSAAANRNQKEKNCLQTYVWLGLRACSHEPGAVNYPGIMIAPGKVLPRVHMITCCPGAMLPLGQLHCPGQVHSHLINTNSFEFLQF